METIMPHGLESCFMFRGNFIAETLSFRMIPNEIKKS